MQSLSLLYRKFDKTIVIKRRNTLKMKKVEVLAPAGSYESLLGAIHAGSDAVYLGGTSFGARAYADNFKKEEMLRAMDYLHLRDKKMYLTLNTLLKDEELEQELYQYLLPYYENGLDAVIVQDIGVMSFINKCFPKLAIHASTQMTLTTEYGIKAMEEMGVTRFVTSRELHLDEIKEIRRNTELEIESFVHGALCYCYSGQCLLSSMLGGRSGNRGKCAQPCRLPYDLYRGQTLISEKATPYLLSPKDICALGIIPELIEAGIDSFKIEGRMKRGEYAAFTAKIYRKYVDYYQELGKEGYHKYLENHREEYEYDRKCLMDLYNRGGFTKGYYETRNGKKMMTMGRPNHSGVYVGKVVKVKGNRATFQLEEDLYAQDILEFRDTYGNALYDYTVKNSVKKQEKFAQSNFKVGSKIKTGDLVYRTKRNQLLNQIRTDYIEKLASVGVVGFFKGILGKPMELTIHFGAITTTVSGQQVEAAKNQPISKEQIERQLKKKGKGNFHFEKLEIEIEGDVFIPVGKLNEIRRIALEELERKVLDQWKRKEEEKEEGIEFITQKDDIKVYVLVNTLEQLKEVVMNKWIHGIYLEVFCEGIESVIEMINIADKNHKKVYYVLPHILRKKEYIQFENALKKESKQKEIFYHKKLAGFLLRNYEEVYLMKKYEEQLGNKELIMDGNLYVFNKRAKDYWMQYGMTRTTVPYELNGIELGKMGLMKQEITVYGHVPLMVSAQCFKKNCEECNSIPGSYQLKDKKGNVYVVKNICEYCYNVIYDFVPISLHKYSKEILEMQPSVIRIEFLNETSKEVVSILNTFEKIYKNGRNDVREVKWNFTCGHYKKGVK